MDATFWATVGLLIFLAIVVYVGVPGMIGRALDARSTRIGNDLDEARRLREEAQRLLGDYQRRRKEAEQEAADIVAAAGREAEALVVEAKARTDEYVVRRSALAEQKIAQAERDAVAEQKIAQAERDAVAEVRSRAVDIAVEAAGRLLADKVDARADTALFKASLDAVKARLN